MRAVRSRRSLEAAGPGNDRNPAICRFDRDFDDPLVLGMAERRAFSSCPAGDEAGRALGNLPFDEVAKGSLIDLGAEERGDKGSDKSVGHLDFQKRYWVRSARCDQRKDLMQITFGWVMSS